MNRLSISRPKRTISFDHNEEGAFSPPRAKVSFDHNEYSRRQSVATEMSKSRHGFFSEFEIIKQPPLQSQLSLQSLTPGPNETYKDKYNCSLSAFFPILRWLPVYELSWLKPDIMAGVTVSILQVPQVLAYAVLAGLPPEWGLYASVVPVVLYSLWSTSTKTAVGPGAPSAIMLASAVNAVIAGLGVSVYDEGYAELYQSIAMTFTFCCGVIFVVLGCLRAGFVIVFLSLPVMTGFIMSASFIIVLSQCKSLMGLDIGRYSLFYENLIAVIENIHTIHWWTTLISCISLVVLFLPKIFPSIPRWVPVPLIVMMFNILLSYFLDLSSLGVDTVGAEIKAGFPLPKVPDFSYFAAVFPAALVVTVVDYMSNIMLAKGFEQKMKDEHQVQLAAWNEYMKSNLGSESDILGNATDTGTGTSLGGIDQDAEDGHGIFCEEDEQNSGGDIPNQANQPTMPSETNQNRTKKVEKPLRLPPVDVSANMEFFAYGIANLFGSFFSSQLISASFSRTALNAEMSGHTRVAGWVRVVLCVLCTLFLMPFLSPLPKCVLASVVITAVYRLIRSGVKEFFFLWRVSKLELIEFIVSVMAPLVIGIEMGIFLSIGTSMIVNLLRHTFAKVIFLGQLKTNKNCSDVVEYVDMSSFKQARMVVHITILELKAELSFSNNLRLVEKIRDLLANGNKYIVVSLNLTSFIDTTAIRQIVTLFEDAKGSYICLSQCRPKVMELIRRYQVSTAAFPPNVKTFISTHDAVRFLQKKRKEQCPDLDFFEEEEHEQQLNDRPVADKKPPPEERDHDHQDDDLSSLKMDQASIAIAVSPAPARHAILQSDDVEPSPQNVLN